MKVSSRRPRREFYLRLKGGAQAAFRPPFLVLRTPMQRIGYVQSPCDCDRVGLICAANGPPPQPSPFQGEGVHRVRGALMHYTHRQ